MLTTRHIPKDECHCMLLQIWNPDALADTSLGHLQQRWNITAYEGKELYGEVHATIVRGHLVYTLEDSVSKAVCGKTVLKQDL